MFTDISLRICWCEYLSVYHSTVEGFTIALIEVQNEALLRICWDQDHTTTANSLCHLSCQLNSFLTISFQHLRHDARWARSLSHFMLGCGGFVVGVRELIAWPLKLDMEQPGILLNACFHLVFLSERKLTSIIAYPILTQNVLPDLCGTSVWWYGKQSTYCACHPGYERSRVRVNG